MNFSHGVLLASNQPKQFMATTHVALPSEMTEHRRFSSQTPLFDVMGKQELQLQAPTLQMTMMPRARAQAVLHVICLAAKGSP